MTDNEEVKALKYQIKDLELQLAQSEDEKREIYGLLGMAHLNLRQHLQYGFNPNTARSTLISVGRYSPKLKAEMDAQEAKQSAHNIKE